jgi:hypothetical protein
MWIVKSGREPVYTVFKNPTLKGMMMKTEKNLAGARRVEGNLGRHR